MRAAVIVIEASRKVGSPDLPFYMDASRGPDGHAVAGGVPR